MDYKQFSYLGKTPESASDHGRIRPHKNIILQQQSQQQTSYYQPHVATAQHHDHARTDKQEGKKASARRRTQEEERKKAPETSMDYRSGSQKIFAQFQNQGSHSKNVKSRELQDRDEQDLSDLDEQDHDEEGQISADRRFNKKIAQKKQPETPSDHGRRKKQSHYYTDESQGHNRLQSAVRGEVTENYQTGNSYYSEKSKEQPGDFGRHSRF